MSVYKFVLIANGDSIEREYHYLCNNCGVEMKDGWPIYFPHSNDAWCKGNFWLELCQNSNIHYCGECAFALGLLSEKEYLKQFCFIYDRKERAGINPITGEVEVTNKKFSWEKTDNDYRSSTEYRQWRTSVFSRDNYTCLDCGAVGGRLEAHHIKTFRLSPETRFDIDNGVTLCAKCHKQKHRKERGCKQK